VILEPDEVARIGRQAQREYPHECCGVVIARDGERRVLPFRNIQNAKHAEDPVRFPRTAEKAYYAHPDDIRAMSDLVDNKGFTLDVIYHSHPNTGAYFSETDREQAAPRSLGEPAWPTATYVVVSVDQLGAQEWAAYRWSGATHDFIEVHREPVPRGTAT
jgi:adenylyltransferase/sulfurtransferase